MISTEKEYEVLEKLIEGFGFGKIQDAITVRRFLGKHNYTMDDLDVYVEWKKEFMMETMKREFEERDKKTKPAREAIDKSLPKCPDCGDILYLYPVKLEAGRGNEFGYKSLWQCKAEDCTYEKYNKEETIDILAPLIGLEHSKTLGFIQ